MMMMVLFLLLVEYRRTFVVLFTPLSLKPPSVAKHMSIKEILLRTSSWLQVLTADTCYDTWQRSVTSLETKWG